MSSLDKEKKAKKALERVKRAAEKDSRKLPPLVDDPRNYSENIGLGIKCHGYLDLDCKTCIEALKQRLQE